MHFRKKNRFSKEKEPLNSMGVVKTTDVNPTILV